MLGQNFLSADFYVASRKGQQRSWEIQAGWETAASFGLANISPASDEKYPVYSIFNLIKRNLDAV